MVNLLAFLATNEGREGTFNACVPEPVTNQVFTSELAGQLHRYALLPAPTRVLKLLLGEMSALLLTGQRAIPQRASDNGFSFTYSTLGPALKNILS
jgi:NAD dependent epimerase/dehydratase family enzyme